MKTLLAAFYLLFFAVPEKANNTSENWICEEQKYTYQIEVINSRDKVALPSSICVELDKHRKQNEDTYYSYSRIVRLHIFSQDKINNGLSPIEQIVYITE